MSTTMEVMCRHRMRTLSASVIPSSIQSDMIHETLPVGMLQCNYSIFGDEQTHEAIVIDPGDDIPKILEILSRHGLSVKAIVITHAHIDHIGGAHKLRKATGAPVYMNQNDTLLRDMLEVQAQWLGV